MFCCLCWWGVDSSIKIKVTFFLICSNFFFNQYKLYKYHVHKFSILMLPLFKSKNLPWVIRNFPEFFLNFFFLLPAQITITSCSFFFFNNKRTVVYVCFCVRCCSLNYKKKLFSKFLCYKVKSIEIKKQNLFTFCVNMLVDFIQNRKFFFWDFIYWK